LQFVASSNQTTVFFLKKFKEEKTKKCFHEVSQKKEGKKDTNNPHFLKRVGPN
jgi:hypothetical protein